MTRAMYPLVFLFCSTAVYGQEGIDITGQWKCSGEVTLVDGLHMTSEGTSSISREKDGKYLSTGSGKSTTTAPDGQSETSAGSSKSVGVLRGNEYHSSPEHVYNSERNLTTDRYDIVSIWKVSSERMELLTVTGNPEIKSVSGTCVR